MPEFAPDSYCAHARGHPFHGPYHDDEYGFPERDDARLFERLCLEMNQAGLSWLTILKKKDNFREAFGGFDPEVVAGYREDDRARLLADPGIVRNRLKVDAAIHNANRLLELRRSHGSFADWLDAHQVVGNESGRRARTKPEWVKLFKKTFRFTGGEITGEFLMSTGYLPGAHDVNCPVHPRIVELGPPWSRTGLEP
jgi:DNA-3-methyladenine glycosylase I